MRKCEFPKKGRFRKGIKKLPFFKQPDDWVGPTFPHWASSPDWDGWPIYPPFQAPRHGCIAPDSRLGPRCRRRGLGEKTSFGPWIFGVRFFYGWYVLEMTEIQNFPKENDLVPGKYQKYWPLQNGPVNRKLWPTPVSLWFQSTRKLFHKLYLHHLPR